MRTVRTLALALIVPLILVGTVQATASLDEHEDAWPTYDEVQGALDEANEHPWMTVHTVGNSTEERPIRVAEITDPGSSTPMEDRAVTYILTQQHGNEPAGTPAALRLIDNVTQEAPIQETLTDQVLLLLPMANPDGSERFQRTNPDGIDTNRDHIALETPEARAMHRVLNMWDVDVVLDHHEYGGTGPGNPVPVRTYDHDLTTLFPRHGNVPQPALESAKTLMYDAIWPAAEQNGYTANEYGEATVHGVPVTELAGGPDPGIARNHNGLHNTASLLVETRVDMHPNPFHGQERRIQMHTVVMESTLNHVHENAERITNAKEASAHLAATFPDTTYQEGESASPFHEAYRFPNAAQTWETFQAHGIHPGEETTHGIVHETGHALHGHAGALIHPDSSRAITTAAPVAPLDAADEDALDTLDTDETPLPPVIVLAALLAAVLIMARTRSR